MLRRKKRINIQNEIILLKYCEILLSNGITNPITEEMFFSLIEEWLKIIENDPILLTSKREIIYSKENFSDIIEKANKITIKHNQKENLRIRFQVTEKGEKVAIPTYSLKKK